MAGSNGQCVTAVQVVSVDLGRTAVAVDLAGAVVEFVGDGVEVALAPAAQVGILRQVLAQ